MYKNWIILQIFNSLTMKVFYIFFAISFTSCINIINDREQRISLATEILKNNKNDIAHLTTKQIKNPILRVGSELLIENRCDCIIDSLAPKFADKHSLTELQNIQKGAISTLSEITELVSENKKVCEDCLLFKK